MSAARPIVLAAGPWRVSFTRVGDRLAHTISLVRDDHATPLLASIEGTPEESWPASPPLQELQVDARTEGRLALAVGMAGKSHWSVSMELDPAAASVSFDIAARLRSEPGPLGNHYRAFSLAAIASDTHGAQFEIAGQRCLLRCDPLIGLAAGNVELTTQGLKITPAIQSSAFPCTIRWKYTLTVE